MLINEEDYLGHVGTKGMKWGSRKLKSLPEKPIKEQKLSRKEKKAKAKAVFLQEKSSKLNDAITMSQRKPNNSLIRVDDALGNRVMTGKEFGDYLVKTGGRVPFREISVWAETNNPGTQYAVGG